VQIKTQSGIKIGTDISKIQVPAKLRIRQNLGIAWVNEALGGGGMTPSTVGMVTGSPGCGKSTLMRQLADSITAQGHLALYNTGEESVYQVKMRCEDMGLTSGFQVGEERYIGKILSHARELQAKNPKKQVFILQDSLQTLDDGHYKNGTTSITPVRCCEQLTDWAKETYGIVLFIGQVTKSGLFAGKNTIRHMVDVHCEILPDGDNKSATYKRLLFTVTKNRFGYTGRSYLVDITKQGLVAGDLDLTASAGDDEEDPIPSPAGTGEKRTWSGVRPKVTVDEPDVEREGTEG